MFTGAQHEYLPFLPNPVFLCILLFFVKGAIFLQLLKTNKNKNRPKQNTTESYP